MKLPETPEELVKYIDNTFLKPDGTEKEFIEFIETSNQYNFKTLFLHSHWVRKAKKLTKIPIGTVAGFPHGAETIEEKTFSAQKGIEEGAEEIDFVLNIQRLKSNDLKYIVEEFKTMRKATQGFILKVILETCYLTAKEKIIALKIAEEEGIDFVKTSTGFGKEGVKIEDVKLLKENSKKIKIKASGGIRTLEFTLNLIKSGAERIGTSTGVLIVKEAIKRYKREGKIWKK